MDGISVENQASAHLKWKLHIKVSLQVIKLSFSSRLAQQYTIFKFKAQGQVLAVFSACLYCSKDVKCFFPTPLICPIKRTNCNCNSSPLQCKQLHSPDSFKRPAGSREPAIGTGYPFAPQAGEMKARSIKLYSTDNAAENCIAHQRIQSYIFWSTLMWSLLFLMWYPDWYHL